MRGRNLLVAATAVLLVAACSGSDDGTPEMAWQTPNPAASAAPGVTPSVSGDTTAGTPGPAATSEPTDAPVPADDLRFSKLTFTSRTCYRTDLERPDGSRAKGMVVSLTFKVTNRGDAATDPLWLVVETKDQTAKLAAAVLFGKNPVGPEYYYTVGESAYFPGRALKAGESLTWKQKVYFRESKRVEFVASVMSGPKPRKAMTTAALLSGTVEQEWELGVTRVQRC